MSTSDFQTDAYYSTDSSTKDLSSTAPDADGIKSRKNSKALVLPIDASPYPAAVAAIAKDDFTPGAAEFGVSPESVARSSAPAEREAFEASITTDGGDCALLQPVVNHRDISLADISRMRSEGCRARHTSLAATTSVHGSMASSLRSASASPMLSLTSRARDQAGVFGETTSGPTQAPQHVPVWSSLIGLSRSIHRRSSMSSARTSALETSVAILQHMAQDTAARVEASCTAHSLAETPSTATSACGSLAPPPLHPAHHHSMHQNAATLDKSVEGGNPSSVADSCSGSEQSTPPLQAVQTRQYIRTSLSSSSLNSLSESELRSGQLRAVGFSRLRAQALTACFANAAAAAKAAPFSRHSSPLPRLEGTPLAARQQSHFTTCDLANQQSGAAATLLELISSSVGTTAEAAKSVPLRHTRDMSVRNHDFQQIIPVEVKEALQRNMRPICEDDDEDDAALQEGLSVQLPPPLTSFAKVTHATCEDRQSLDAPSTDTDTRGVTGSGGGGGAGATPADAPFNIFPSSLRAQSALAASPSLLAPPTVASSKSAWHAGSTYGGKPVYRLGSGTAENMAAGLSISGTGVPFQTWKFPSLGKPNCALSLRNMSLGEDANAEEGSPGGAVGGPGPAPQSAAPPSDHGGPAGVGAVTSGSQQHQGSECTPFTHNGLLAADKRSTLKTATTSRTSAAAGALSVTGDAGRCAMSLLSGGCRTHKTASCAHGSSTQFTGAAVISFAQPPAAASRSFGAVDSFSDVADSSNVRKLEMLCAVYERLLGARPPARTFAAAAPKSLQTLLSPSLTEAMMAPRPAPSAAPAALLTPLVGRAPPSAAGVGFEATNQGCFTPSMSYSGALGRSAGYYSFGKRISLSHPNRQTLPHQFLGSASSLHAMPSPRMTMVGSSALAESIATPNGDGSGLAIASSSTARLRSRTWDVSLLRRIESRPLLQTTLFLQHNLRSICEAQAWRARLEREEDSGLARRRASISPSMPTAAAANITASAASVKTEHLRQYTFPTELQCAAGAPSPASVFDVDTQENAAGTAQMRVMNLALMATNASPAISVSAAAAREPNTTRSGNNNGTHDSAAGTALLHPFSSSTSQSVNASNLPLRRIKDLPETQEEQIRKQTDVCIDHTAGAAVATEMESCAAANRGPSTAADVPVAHESNGSPSHRYYRPLTRATRLMRHIHGVDGVEREVDNDSMDLVVYVGMQLMGWLEVVGLLGCGSFGQVFLCKDLRICDGHFVHPSEIEGEDYEYWNCSHAYLPFSSVDAVPTHQPLVAVKVVKSVPLLEQQSVLEAEMLVLIGAQIAPLPVNAVEGAGGSSTPAFAATTGDHAGASAPPPEDPRCANIAKVLADGICYGHHCIVMERYGANLYEYIAANDHRGLPLHQIRSIGAQLLSALTLVHEECHIIHADIKPENVLLTLDFCRGTLREKDEPLCGITSTSASTTAVGIAKYTNTSTAAVADTSPHDLSELKASSRPAHSSARDKSLHTEPQSRPQRTECTALLSSSSSLPAERSGTLQVGPGAIARQRVCLYGKQRNSNPLLEASSSGVAVMAYKRHSFCHHGANSASHASAVEQTDLPTPEPRRSQLLNQSGGMLSSAANSVHLPSLSGGGPGSCSGRVTQAAATPVEETLVVPRASPISHLHVRLIDFSSSCYKGGPFYEYIQSRYYRAPEVIAGVPYSSEIDIWSTGCVLAELLLGMPLLPGCNDHHQLSLIEEMVGPLPDYMIEDGDNADVYYTAAATVDEGSTGAGQPRAPSAAAPGATLSAALQQPRRFALRSREDYLEVTGGEPVVYRRYFTYQTLQELVRHCPLTLEERRMSYGLPPHVPANESPSIPPDATPSPSVRSDMMKQRFLLFDLLRRLLQVDPKLRPSAEEALTHPFFTSSPAYLTTFALE
ncbi:hypothetical protein CUR178_06400 [Leishmania enriettii]|uniref:Protein kinase domain-containing protein n=1 Tax=Leishmania enriettii TaxID=5663 RepID=A0A836HR95_LEIEN|nr:hypothetical protein CUR178_06400 [Leishmania enriettii]